MPLWKIEPSLPYFHKNTSDIDLGGRCEALLAKKPLLDQENRFRLHCPSFMVELCSQIKRFNFSESRILSQLNVINPKVAFSSQERPKSLASKFSTLVKELQLDYLQNQ